MSNSPLKNQGGYPILSGGNTGVPVQDMFSIPSIGVNQLDTTAGFTQGLFTSPSSYRIPSAQLQTSPTAAAGSGFMGNMGNFAKTAAGGAAIAGGVGGIIQGLVGRRKRRNEQRRAKAEYLKQKRAFSAFDTSNLAAGFQNTFKGMQNTFEDLTVNQKQAQFESQQNQQNQANIMSNFAGAAGGSGIASLAQVIANQSQLATQKASASIGLQESRNEMMSAKAAASNQAMERKGEMQAQTMRLKGADSARNLRYQKQQMELGFAMQEKAAADQAVQTANAALFGGIGSLATTALTAGLMPPGAGAAVGAA